MLGEEISFESLFTEDYWGHQTRFPKQHRKSRIPRRLYDESGALVEDAASSIFRHEPLDALLRGTSLTPESEHLQPGTVFLFDLEMLARFSRQRNFARSHPDTPHYFRREILDEAELIQSAASLFRSNSTRKTNKDAVEQIVVYPYKKVVLAPEQTMFYGRGVGLAISVPDKRGQTRLKARFQWGDSATSSVIGEATSWRDLLLDLPEGLSIGETYHVAKKRSRPDMFMRVKSIDIATRGVLEAAKEKAKTKNIVWLGRRALNPNFG